ncbi:MAG: single-stranded DNA-binding protein, partial [Oscillospiraceae bacterium]|nr:single-stranded DNA-binding protein [Oscillospiraceae bacterium]
MLNHIVIMGRLTRDPELRYTQSQTPVVSFSVAVDRDFGGRDGGEKQTDFIDCVAWRSTAEFVSKYFRKGSMVVVSGRLQIRDWQDRDGNKRR